MACSEYFHDCFKIRILPCDTLKHCIFELVKEGIPFTRALEIYGVDPFTLSKWKELAKNGNEEMVIFNQTILKAETEFEINLIRKASGNASAAAKLLEARFPNRWKNFEPSELEKIDSSAELISYLPPETPKTKRINGK